MTHEAITRNFDSYKIYYITSAAKPFPAVISCFAQGEEIGVLRFLVAGQKIQPPNVEPGKITLDYPIERFGDVHRILLHESPLALYVSPERHWGGVVTRELEPTGEMEQNTEFFQRLSDSVSSLNKG